MTGREIRNAAEVYVGESIENDMALIAINEALTVIGDMGLIYGTVTIQAESGQEYYMPADFTNIRTVYDSDNQPYSGWSQLGDAIRFEDAGEYKVYSRRTPSRLTSIDEIPDVSDSYHNSIVRFLRLFAIQAGSDEIRDKRHRFDSFEEDVSKIHSGLNRVRQPRQVKVIRHA